MHTLWLNTWLQFIAHLQGSSGGCVAAVCWPAVLLLQLHAGNAAGLTPHGLVHQLWALARKLAEVCTAAKSTKSTKLHVDYRRYVSSLLCKVLSGLASSASCAVLSCLPTTQRPALNAAMRAMLTGCCVSSLMLQARLQQTHSC
jgi:hypothetical protein